MNRGTKKTVNPSIRAQQCLRRGIPDAKDIQMDGDFLGASLRSSIILAFLSLLLVPLDAKAFDLSYGGRLTGPAGEPVAGPLDLTFRFFREASGGTALVTITVPNVPLMDGVFHTPVPISAEEADRLFEDGDQTVFVEVESQGKVYPRQKFSYVPLALRVPVDGTKIVYDSQGRLTLGTGTTTGTFPGISGTGGVEKTGDQSYSTYPISAAGKSLMGAATPAAQRTALGLGTMAERNSISPSDLSSSTCADGTVLRKGPSGWGCETLGPSNLSSLVSQTEFEYLDGVTSPIQTQLNNRVSSAGGTMSGPLTLSQGSELRLATSNAGVSAGFKAPANLPTSTIYTLPSGLPANGQMLTSSSSGLLSWSNVPVTSVNGQIGSVSLNADNIDETGTRKYFSQALARQSISTTGLLSYNPSTGVMSLSDTLLTKSGGTMTGSLDFAGTLKVTNLADPTADGDAAKKAYVDGKLGGQPLVVGTPSPGQVIKWDGSKFALASDELGQPGGGIASLNTLTSGSQSLAVDIPGVSAGTRPNWTAESATSTHRLTIPMASASGVTAGLISRTDYDVFSSKQDGITPSSFITLGSLSTNLQNALEVKPYGTSAAQTGEMRFRELNASGVNYVGLKSPDNLATNTIWTLPSGDGTSGFVLSTDGSGTLSWISPTTGSVTSIVTGTGLAGGLISGAGTISLANVGTAGTYTKVTTNAQGQVISGSSLADTDIPNLSATKITSGTLAVDRGGTGVATAQPFFVLAGPGVGPTAGAPSFRTLVAADIPSLDASKITSGTLANSLINWAAAPVTTVSGRTGAVTLSNTDISGLGSLATANAVSGGGGGTITDDSITNADISSSAAITDNKLATIVTSGKVANSATTATSAGTANAIVARDASGNFTAGTITATLNGNATNVTGTVALANGGTGATTAASARTNLGAAASGANTDITSLTNLTTLSTTGNVGIGSDTPSFRLDVATSGAGMQTVERLQNTVTAANNSGAQTMYSANRTTGGLTDVAAIGGTIADISASAYKGALVFATANNAAPAERMRIDANGNVGVGTTSPSGTFHVVANLDNKGQKAWSYFQTNVHASMPNENAWGLAIGSNYSAGSSEVNFVNASNGDGFTFDKFGAGALTRLFTIKGTGNVGIGTTSPLANLGVGSGNLGISLGTNDVASGAWIRNDGVNTVFSTNVGSMYFGFGGSTKALNFYTGSSVAMVVASNGNVGIGTTSPTSALEVLSSNRVVDNGSGVGGAYFGTTENGAIDVGGSVYLGGSALSTVPQKVAFGGLSGRKENSTSGNFAGYLQFATNNSGGTMTEKMRITSTGNVGIGTSSPSNKLQINPRTTHYYNGAMNADAVAIFGTSATLSDLDLGSHGAVLGVYNNNAFAVGRGGSIALGGRSLDFGGGEQIMTFGRISGVQRPDNGAYYGHLVFETHNSGVILERMRIDHNGAVGIGTTSPAQKLDVRGNLVASSFANAGEGSFIGLFKDLGSLPGYPAYRYPTVRTDFTNLYFSVGGAYSSYISSNGAYTSVSDRNRKENFVELNPQEVLEKLDHLPMMEWNFKGEDPNIRHIGPIAQDFHAAFHLNGSDDTKISHIDPAGVAIVGVKGLLHRVKDLEAQNAALEREVRELKNALCASLVTLPMCREKDLSE